MQGAKGVWQAIVAATTFVAREVATLLSLRSIDIVEDNELRLVLRSGNRTTVVDRGSRTVRIGRRKLLKFSSLESIEVKQRQSDDDDERWSVRLRSLSESSESVGLTHDATEASIVGAKLATVLGLPVQAIK